ncbi:MAG: hypothetical protein LAQ30_01895 [Acidobacteriia bacterium]|nr:hypothetical protein [Terriglobia bacterium]
MPYEIFARTTARKGAPPTINIAANGRLGLNKAAAELLHKEAIGFALLLWDADARKIAVRPIKKKDPRAFTVTFSKGRMSAGISAKSFCDYIGVDYSQTRGYQAKWNDNESALEIDLGRAEFANGRQKPEAQKRSARAA